ncbi:Keratin, type I cytoskeletal 18-B [Varanus komodoensis]|nr:Keratin, type I cytoskeletal 18-B [Varanus komodoensis]
MNLSHHLTASFSTRSHGSLPARSSTYRASLGGFQPALFRASSGASLSPSPAFLLSSLPSLEIDPKLHQIRTEEKEQIKGLNNQFASFINKVQPRMPRGQNIFSVMYEVEDLNMENVRLLLQIDNARLAADDYNHKLEVEQAACDGVQKDTHGLRKMIDDTNFLRMKLEGDLESFREELAHLRKSHKEEVEALSALVANSDVTVQVDNPQKNDLSEMIAEIRNQYEKVAEQNRTDAENWYKTKFDSMSQEAAVNTQALEEAKNELTELRRQMQGLEIERQTLQKMAREKMNQAPFAVPLQRQKPFYTIHASLSLPPPHKKSITLVMQGVSGVVHSPNTSHSVLQVETLENTLKNTGDHYRNDMANLNHVIAKLQDDLAACRADLERQARDYETLLDIKSKLENEIEHYRNLIEGATVRGELQSSGKTDTRRQTIKKVVVTTQEIVDGKVVAQRSEEATGPLVMKTVLEKRNFLQHRLTVLTDQYHIFLLYKTHFSPPQK